MSAAPTWLLQARVDERDFAAAADVPAAMARAAATHGLGVTRVVLRTPRTGGPGAEGDEGLLYAYLHAQTDAHTLDGRGPAAPRGPKVSAEALTRSLAAALPLLAPLSVSPLLPAFTRPGASAGQAARFHYVVETDPEAGWHDEIVRWYDQEHMPGLAAVPGCIGARRAINPGAGPWSLACYDLVDRDVPETAPWLAVRGTAWSSRTRPHFTNTRRTMFEVIA